MSNRQSFYTGENVSESELNGAFDDAENAEFTLAANADLKPALTTSTPDPTVYGGITSGLTVHPGAPGDTFVTVDAGDGRDSRGYHNVLPTGGATVALSNLGSSTEGDVTLALGDGAALNLGSVPAGQYAILSLWLVYDEHLTDPRVDATGATVYFSIAESFHFYITMGMPYISPPGAPPSRAVLEDQKLLLADLVIRNDAGTIKLVKVCNATKDWIDLGGNYVTLIGRRYDCLSIDQSADHPQYTALSMDKRFTSIRQAVAELNRELQKQTSAAGDPAGAEIIGAKVQAGTLAYIASAAASLTAGSLSSQLTTLLSAINTKAARGGDIIQPVPASSGLIFDPLNMNVDEALIATKAMGDGVSNYHRLWRKFGHVTVPHEMFDDFLVGGHWGASVEYNNSPDRKLNWFWFGHAATGVYRATSYRGGVIAIETGAANNDGVSFVSGMGDNDATGAHIIGDWNCGASPFAIAAFRFMLPAVVDLELTFGLIPDTALGGPSLVEVLFKPATSANLIAKLTNSVGGTAQADLVTPMTNGWYTVRIAVVSAAKAIFQVNDIGTEVPAALGAGSLASGGYCAYFTIRTKAGAFAMALLDSVYAADGLRTAGL